MFGQRVQKFQRSGINNMSAMQWLYWDEDNIDTFVKIRKGVGFNGEDEKRKGSTRKYKKARRTADKSRDTKET